MMIDATTLHFMDKVLRSKGFNPDTAKLKFSFNNSKLNNVITFSLPAGHSCPFAKDCRSCALRNPRKRHDIGDKRKWIIKDGSNAKFRCFIAIDEVLRPSVRESRWWNFLTLLSACQKGLPHVVQLINENLPNYNKIVRVDVSGDFFSQIYFDAWLKVARLNPNQLFYAYTKALPFWIKRLKHIPSNFKLTASYGGTHDWMIKQYGLCSATVVSSPKEAKILELPIDHDDRYAMMANADFALLVHGQQPAGTPWAKAWMKLKKQNMGGYGRQKAGTIRGG